MVNHQQLPKRRPSLGTRLELLPMDTHCGDITVSLYRQEPDGEPVAIVHTFSSRPGAAERVEGVARAMAVLGGLEPAGPACVRLACGAWHEAAIRRTFLEAVKLAPTAQPEPRGFEIDDRQTGQQIVLEPLGHGSYRVHAHRLAEGETSRAGAVARGLVKLAELETHDDPTRVSFPCGQDHHALAALLLVRALNVRAVLREEEAIASRGVLSAPSASGE